MNKILFLTLSYIGQALSWGKIYASHVAFFLATPSLFLNTRRIIVKRELLSPLLFLTFCGWYLVTNLWVIDLRIGIKASVLVLFGLSQFIIASSLDKKQLSLFLKIALLITIIDFIIGFGEMAQLWRFPLSELNSNVTFWNKSTDIFRDLHKDSIAYIASSPTGLRWSANNFVFTLHLTTLFLIQFGHRRLAISFILITAISAVFAGSRILFIGMPLIYLILWISKKDRKAIGLTLIMYVGALVSIYNLPIHARWKAYEIIQFPNVVLNMLNSETKTISTFNASGKYQRSEVARSMLLLAGLQKIKASPIIGLGPGAGLYTISEEEAWSLHNVILEIWVDSGLIGIGLLLAFLLVLLSEAKTYSPEYLPLTFSFLIALGLGGISLSSLNYFPPAYIGLGLLTSLIRQKKYEVSYEPSN